MLKKTITLLLIVLSTVLIKSGMTLKSGDSYKIGNTTLLQESQFNLDNIRIDGNSISVTETNGNLVVTPNGTGDLFLGSSLQVLDSGWVGIGTSNATNPLHIYSEHNDPLRVEGDDHSIIVISGKDGSERSIDIRQGNDLRWKIGMDNWPVGTEGYFTIKQSNNSPAAFTIDTNDEVGIGLTNPSAKLHVSVSSGAAVRVKSNNDHFTLEHTSGHSWRIFVDHNNYLQFKSNTSGNLSYLHTGSSGIISTSDKRKKKNIKVYNKNVLESVVKLKAKTFHFKTQDNNKPKKLGFIAQDIKQYFPELVIESNGMLGLEYSGLGVIAIEAIKQLKLEKDQEINELKEAIEKLSSQIQKLENTR